jgi:hypothetical protein
MTLKPISWRFTLTMAFAMISTAVVAQQSLSVKYGSREPRTCASKKEPTKGVLSAEQANKYLVCYLEGEIGSNNLYLLEDTKVEVGKGTPFLQIPFNQRPGTADPNGMVYQIRGSYKKFQCGVQHSDGFLMNAGKNCSSYDNPKATGSCFRDNFGDWICNMADLSGLLGTHDQPPPK